MTDVNHLQVKANRCRRAVLDLVRHGKTGHTGGSLSCVDILVVLYNRVLSVTPATLSDPNRDRYVQSKGHAVEALYAVLADRGFITQSDLDTFSRSGSALIGHPTRAVAGVEANTGALGHGLPIAAGMALAGKMDGRRYRVFTLLGDGECAEGSNWEAALFAAHHKLDNLTAIVDRNRLQISGGTEDVCGLDPLDAKFAAFGWSVVAVDGHDVGALCEALGRVPLAPGKPSLVIANTVKGRGISFMENQASWHHGVPSEEQYRIAVRELDEAFARLSSERG
jgi:transketolase